MKTYCLVCKNYTDNNNSRVVKNKQKLLLKSNCSVCGNKKICLLQRGMVYLICSVYFLIYNIFCVYIVPFTFKSLL